VKIVILGNYSRGLLLFRIPLIRRMVELGHSVIACAPEADGETTAAIEQAGAQFRRLPLSRTSVNPIRDLWFCLTYWRLLRREAPDIALGYTIKPVVIGTLIAAWAGVPRRYAIVTGLGYVFTQSTARARVLKWAILPFYRLALSKCRAIFFLNPDDLATLRNLGVLADATARSQTIRGEGIDLDAFEADASLRVITLEGGSGVDLDQFATSTSADRRMIFLLIGRLLRDKGVGEYVEAARQLKRRYPTVQFWIVGPFDTHPSALRQKDIEQWQADGTIVYHGEARDVRPFLRRCTVFVLPSYREGLPRTVIEAMAIGRAIITTDAPGCRDTVVDGENGFLVPIKNVEMLANAMEKLITDPSMARAMGRRSRELVVDRYDVKKVNDVILKTMELA
jgi:glycosyltransferase involved in cell wall biosynthesis